MSCTKKIPKFKSLEEESDFWDTHSFVDFWDELEDVKGHFVDARPKKLVSIRFDPELITAAKRIARTKGLGYQTLLRMWAYEGLNKELRSAKPRTVAAKKRAS
jgi:predicted DNA binding CopG/RHH family protein